MEHCPGTGGYWLLALTRVWLGAAGVHLDMSLCWDPQDVPLHIDVILAQVYPHLHVVAAALLRGVGVDVEQVNLKWNIFFMKAVKCSPE